MVRITKFGNYAERKDLSFMSVPRELKIKKTDGIFINQGSVFQQQGKFFTGEPLEQFLFRDIPHHAIVLSYSIIHTDNI